MRRLGARDRRSEEGPGDHVLSVGARDPLNDAGGITGASGRPSRDLAARDLADDGRDVLGHMLAVMLSRQALPVAAPGARRRVRGRDPGR